MGTASARSLGAALRKLRTERDNPLTLDEVAQHFEWHKSKLSRIERGLTAAPIREVRGLINYYEVEDQDLVDAMLRLAQGGRRGSWIHGYRDVMPRQFAAYLGLEAEAASLHAWQPNLVPGLLQTAGYARALVLAWKPGKNDVQAAQLVEARMERQAILRGPDAPVLHAIIGEGALHRMVGGTQVMGEQLARLAEVAERPNVRLQVVPNSAGAYTPEECGFQMLRFADSAAGDVVCVDLLTRTLYVDDRGEVEQYRDAWEDVLGKAAPQRDSLKMIKAAAEETGP